MTRNMYGRRSLCLIYLCILSSFINVDGFEFFTEKPSYIKSCKIYEPGFTKCSTESIQGVMDEVVKGIPELKGIVPDLDPVRIDRLIFKQDNNEAATIQANLTDIVVTGFSKLMIKESKVSKKDFSWQTKIFVPNMRIDGSYKMNGRILLIPLNGAGKMFIDIQNVDILMRTKTQLYEKAGFTFYNVTQVRVDLEMSGLTTNFENIFNGNSKEVEIQTNKLFNKNWREFFEALRPVIVDAVEKVLMDLMQPLFHALPAKFIVEDIPTSEKLYNIK